MTLLHLPIPTTKLFDGLNDDFYTFTHRVEEPAGVIIRQEDFYRNALTELAALLSPPDFSQLVREGNFRKTNALFAEHAYEGTDKLELTYCRTGPYLFVFASGEFQPARYKIYLEGVWQILP